MLNVRSGPGTQYAVVGQLRYNSEVLIYEERSLGARYRIGAGAGKRMAPDRSRRLLSAWNDATGCGDGQRSTCVACPGVSADNPPVDRLRYGAMVTIYEETLHSGATWYRIGVERWVHGGWIRLLPAGQGHAGEALSVWSLAGRLGCLCPR